MSREAHVRICESVRVKFPRATRPFHALIDLGFETTLAQRVRLRRIDAPEILTAEGKDAKAYLEKILSRDQGRILIKSIDIDQHGRPIADVWVKDQPVDQELLDKGLAVRISE
mgnify:CR=1 FL=1